MAKAAATETPERYREDQTGMALLEDVPSGDARQAEDTSDSVRDPRHCPDIVAWYLDRPALTTPSFRDLIPFLVLARANRFPVRMQKWRKPSERNPEFREGERPEDPNVGIDLAARDFLTCYEQWQAVHGTDEYCAADDLRQRCAGHMQRLREKCKDLAEIRDAIETLERVTAEWKRRAPSVVIGGEEGGRG